MGNVYVNAPSPITLTDDHGKQVTIPAGVSPQGEGLASHWYFKASGGQVLGPVTEDADTEAEDEAEMAEDEAELEAAQNAQDAEKEAEAKAKIEALKQRHQQNGKRR